VRRFAKAFVLAALALESGGCAPSGLRSSEPWPAVDGGGNLRGYFAEVKRLNAQRAGKRIDGDCVSACTAFLGVKNVCVTPAARLWFHAASLPGAAPDALGSLEMLSYYPPRVRAWAIRTGALESVTFRETKVLTGEQLVLMGVAACHDHGAS
jgi:hypothetical protein